jgi:hypothetical protein
VPTAEQRVRDVYGFAFPDDFFRYREFLRRLPRGLLGKACDMHPAMPFRVAAGKPAATYPQNPLWEERYYHDLPEFITLFTGTTDGLHWGYVFDAPGERPPVVAHYWHSDTFQHGIDGDNVFEATRWQLEQSESGLFEMIDDDPDEEAAYRKDLERVAAVRGALSEYWGADRPETGEDYLSEYEPADSRKPIARTWDALGVVVPRAKYAKLSSDPWVTNTGRVDLDRPQVEKLIAEATAALAKGRPGAALKLGRDLWVWAAEYPECYALLDAAYSALGREPLRRLLAEARGWREHCDRQRQ